MLEDLSGSQCPDDAGNTGKIAQKRNTNFLRHIVNTALG